MNKVPPFRRIRNVVFVCILLFITACSSTKNVPYFQDAILADSGITNSAVFMEPTIQPDDILSISIFTIDPKTGALINQVASQAIQNLNAPTGISVAPTINGFLVDKNGDIELAVIGKVNLLGLTTFKARDLIREKANKDFTDPSVQVRFANFKVTILGEVSRPATYTVPNEKVTVLDALGLAGDLTIFGKRENVLLIRDNNGKKELKYLNLNSVDLFNSPYFYLKQNDVIYVEPNKGKAASLNSARVQTIGLIGTALSVLIVLFSRT